MKRDIRELLERADVPEKQKSCPGLERCGQAQEGADPCAGCKVRARLDWRPKYQASYYAVFLAAYLEAFRLSPRELSWLDFEIYQLYLTARAEHENVAARNYWKKRDNINKIN